MWFTIYGSGSVGRIITNGTVSKYAYFPTISSPGGIAAGPDRALRFVNYGSIYRMTTGGAVSSYTGTSIDYPADIAAGADGAMWFTNPGNNSIGRIQVAAPTTLTTSLSGAGQTGASITVPAGTSVTDSAQLTGANAASAGGTVSYSVYSDSASQNLVAARSAAGCRRPQTPRR
jgi:virginiamycin B lyase